jgi:AcrR family transcriptional regulator
VPDGTKRFRSIEHVGDDVEVADRTRPRVEGQREEEILAATLQLLSENGYDRLTMDAVATAARASKATLYRRWSTKADLVVDAVGRTACLPSPEVVDTGSLRGDLLAFACGAGGLTDRVPMDVLGSVMTAVHREPELAAAVQQSFIAPRLALTRAMFERAAQRGELAEGADVDLLTQVLPAMVVHRIFVYAAEVTPAFIEQVVDEVLLPACRAETLRPAHP